MARHILYIINPISGSRKKHGLQEYLTEHTQAKGIDCSVFPSVADGNYNFLDAHIKENKVTDIAIAGGDGTINQAINSLRKHDLPFGIIPCGSGNGLALSAQISKNVDQALKIIIAGKSQRTDAFLINDKFACMLCGLGFDAQVAHDFANDPKRGLSTYIKKTINHFFIAKAYPFSIVSGGEELVTDAFFISIANSNQFGNNFRIAPKASLTDGMLDIVIVCDQNKIGLLWNTVMHIGGFNKLTERSIAGKKASIVYFQTSTLKINNYGNAPLHIDGDPVETKEVFDISVIPHCFRLIVP